MRKRALWIFGGIAALTLLAYGVADAGTQTFNAAISGSAVDLPIDLDGDTCFTIPSEVIPGNVTVCTDFSSYANLGGQTSQGGRFTGQALN